MNEKTVIRGGYGIVYGFSPDINPSSAADLTVNAIGINSFVNVTTPGNLAQPSGRASTPVSPRCRVRSPVPPSLTSIPTLPGLPARCSGALASSAKSPATSSWICPTSATSASGGPDPSAS